MNESSIKVLLIEDNPGDVRLIREMLKEAGIAQYELECVDRLSKGLECLAEGDFDVLLLDLGLPDCQGLDTLSSVCTKVPKVPAIVLTGLADEMAGIKAIQEGAQDYLMKGRLDSKLLVRTIHYAIERHGLLAKLEGTTDDLEQTVTELRNANRRILDQQKSLIEKERLKTLLQIAGAAAHELGQPLTALLGNIELMSVNRHHPEESDKYMDRIKKAGERISDIVKRIQDIRRDETIAYVSEIAIINLDQKLSILTVEGTEDDLERIHTILKDYAQINLSRASSIGEAMQILKNAQVDLIFLNHVLPDGDSLDFLKIMSKKGLAIPAVVITNQANEVIASKVILAGACDCLPKEMVSERRYLSQSIYSAMEKFCFKKKVNLALQKMTQMATRDKLTGVYNRQFFMEALERDLAQAKRYRTGLVILMIDLDHFKKINDTYGHEAGNMAVREISNILLDSLRRSDLISRYSGEEFAVILPNTDVEKATAVGDRLRKRVSKHQFEHKSSKFQVKVTIGMAAFDSSRDQSPIELLNNASPAPWSS